MWLSAFVLFYILLTAVTFSDGMNITNSTCPYVYPAQMMRPPRVRIEGIQSRILAKYTYKRAASIAFHQMHRLDQLMWNCIAVYSKTYLDDITKKSPIRRGPSNCHTSEVRALCAMHALNHIMPKFIPDAEIEMNNLMRESGLDPTYIDDVKACQDWGLGNDLSPRTVGTCLASKMVGDLDIDGWNSKGKLNRKGNVCQFNCHPYQDPTGYAPVNTPWNLTYTTRWQPLIETNDSGYFCTQEHLTPHIGKTVKPRSLSLTEYNSTVRQLPTPNINYSVEIEKVLERVGSLTDFQKIITEFMDNKLNIAFGILNTLREEFNLSFEAQVFFSLGYSSTQLDTLLLAWREKVKHDRVRPTSLVNSLMPERKVRSFKGTEITGADWTAYMRVMPHAEYPSGSGCICIGLAQYVDEFVTKNYSPLTTLPTSWTFPAGSSIVQPQSVPAKEITVIFANMTELHETCGESRLWGGMHFPQSVADAQSLCNKIGNKAYNDLMLPLLGASRYSYLTDASQVEPFSLINLRWVRGLNCDLDRYMIRSPARSLLGAETDQTEP